VNIKAVGSELAGCPVSDRGGMGVSGTGAPRRCGAPGAPYGGVENLEHLMGRGAPGAPHLSANPFRVQYLVPLLAVWSCQLLFLTCLPLLKTRLTSLLNWGAAISLQYYRPADQ
jgi:hypothetical protein